MGATPLAGRVIVMTGAAHRGSLDLIRRLGGAGASLALWATVPVLSRERRAYAEGITARARADAWGDEADIQAAVDEVMAEFGRIDALIHQFSHHLAYGAASPDAATRRVVASMQKPGLVVYVQSEGEAQPHVVEGPLAAFVPVPERTSMGRQAGTILQVCVQNLTSPVDQGG